MPLASIRVGEREADIFRSHPVRLNSIPAITPASSVRAINFMSCLMSPSSLPAHSICSFLTVLRKGMRRLTGCESSCTGTAYCWAAGNSCWLRHNGMDLQRRDVADHIGRRCIQANRLVPILRDIKPDPAEDPRWLAHNLAHHRQMPGLRRAAQHQSDHQNSQCRSHKRPGAEQKPVQILAFFLPQEKVSARSRHHPVDDEKRAPPAKCRRRSCCQSRCSLASTCQNRPPHRPGGTYSASIPFGLSYPTSKPASPYHCATR